MLGGAVERFDRGCEGLARGDEWRAEYEAMAAWFGVKFSGVNN